MLDETNLIYLKHNLAVLGLPSLGYLRDRLYFNDMDTGNSADINWKSVENGALLVVLRPNKGLLQKLCISDQLINVEMANLEGQINEDTKKYNLRTLNPYFTYTRDVGAVGNVVVRDSNGRAVWLAVKVGLGCVLVVGSDIENDILRFRQGDPASVGGERGGDIWGIKGERPNYLFEKQISGLHKHARQADYWPHLLVTYICSYLQIESKAILPGGVAGAVIITGDDDQAFLDKYEQQQELLNGTPITYFLHPKTRHTKKTLKSMSKGKRIDFGIHPDALENPNIYKDIFKSQCEWYKDLIKSNPISVRNHGYLNDGYWGHLNVWVEEGVKISSNIPGLDGSVLNGSLLPAKLYIKSQLLDHWSLLTAIGDGVRYILSKSEVESAKYIYELRDAIVNENIPGVIVINLHPQNISDTESMHIAAKEIIKSGFIAWTMHDCLMWFEEGRVNKSKTTFSKWLLYLKAKVIP